MRHGNGFRFDLRELSGALGDLGTLLPLMLGTIAVVGLAPVPVVLGFALAYIGTALIYRLPIPVQPMKAVAAVLLTVEMTPASLAASGVIIGAVLLVLGATGWIDRLGRLVPQSVLAGLQLGLGAGLAVVSLGLIGASPWLGAATLLLLVALLRFPRLPAALLAIGFAVVAGRVFGLPALAVPAGGGAWPGLVGLPTWPELERGVAVFVLPQLALTFSNAVILTALIAGDYFGERARAVTPRALAISTGLGNMLLAPFGALPMCHGAGGARRARPLRGAERRGAADARAGAAGAGAGSGRGAGAARGDSRRRARGAADGGVLRARGQPAAVGLPGLLLSGDRGDRRGHLGAEPVLGAAGGDRGGAGAAGAAARARPGCLGAAARSLRSEEGSDHRMETGEIGR